MRVLVIEDDQVIADRLRIGLERAGYTVDLAFDGERGMRLALDEAYSLIILDLMLPKKSGFEVCKGLRGAKIATPIIMLTARDQVDDKVTGLDLGADDYLPKPFDFAELSARIRALIRRDKTEKSSVITLADLELDLAAKTVKRDGTELHLTPREFSLLAAMMQNQGRVVTREQIVSRIWDDDESYGNTVNFHVNGLRKKIDSGREKSIIQTVHGFGYRMGGDGQA